MDRCLPQTAPEIPHLPLWAAEWVSGPARPGPARPGPPAAFLQTPSHTRAHARFIPLNGSLQF